MAIIQQVENGQIVQDASADSLSSTKKRSNSSLDKEAFLQLLVAQMQYQDPLEPTSNTEWVAQMATFSMVESLNNMQQEFAKQSANSLVGKYVLINDGDNGFVKGKVDYITKEDGKTKLCVNDKLYDIDKLDTVVEEEYYLGSVKANEFHEMVKLLPPEQNLTINDEGLVKSAREEYDKMTDTQKKFVQKEYLDKLRALEAKMDSLKATQFTGVVKGLPSAGEVEEADRETLAEYTKQMDKAKELYENLTDSQRKNVAEETINQYNAVKEAVDAANKKFGNTTGEEDPKDEAAALLQQILDELKAQNKNNNTDSSNETDESTEGTESSGSSSDTNVNAEN